MEAPAAATATSNETFLQDSAYILEMNLHKVRRELILMIDVLDNEDCKNCNRLKCSCPKLEPPSAESTSTAKSDLFSHSTSSVDFSIIAPSADMLPDPMWESTPPKTCSPTIERDVQSWVRACTPTAPPNLPEARTSELDTTVTYSGIPLRYNNWTGESHHDLLTNNATFNPSPSKLPYWNKPSYSSGVTTNAEHSSQNYLSQFRSSTATSNVETDLSNLAVTRSQSHVNYYPALFEAIQAAQEVASRNAVDSFFHQFKAPAAPRTQTNISFTLSQLAAAFKAPSQNQASRHTYN